MCKIGYCSTLMKTRTAAHNEVDPHTINSLFYVFPSDICRKINKLLKSYDYRLTNRCLALDRKSTPKFHYTSSGRHSHVLRAYCKFESRQAILITLFARRPNNIIVTWTYEDLFSFVTSFLSKGSFLLRSNNFIILRNYEEIWNLRVFPLGNDWWVDSHSTLTICLFCDRCRKERHRKVNL